MSKKAKLCVDILRKDLDIKIINADKIKKWGVIGNSLISSVGLELANIIPFKNVQGNIIGWGKTILNWFSQLDISKVEEMIAKIFIAKPPLVIITEMFKGQIYDLIVRLANEYQIPITILPNLSFAHSIIEIYLLEKFNKSHFIHGSFVIINGVGVIVIGAPSIGKSEAVLELIQKNHIFVSDDTVVIKRLGRNYFGTSAPITEDLLEARGIGIINIRHIYGSKSVRRQGKIHLVVELTHRDGSANADRLGSKKLKYNILNGKIDKIRIPVTNGKNISTLIEVAANKYITEKYGQNTTPLELIDERSKNA